MTAGAAFQLRWHAISRSLCTHCRCHKCSMVVTSQQCSSGFQKSTMIFILSLMMMMMMMMIVDCWLVAVVVVAVERDSKMVMIMKIDDSLVLFDHGHTRCGFTLCVPDPHRQHDVKRGSFSATLAGEHSSSLSLKNPWKSTASWLHVSRIASRGSCSPSGTISTLLGPSRVPSW